MFGSGLSMSTLVILAGLALSYSVGLAVKMVYIFAYSANRFFGAWSLSDRSLLLDLIAVGAPTGIDAIRTDRRREGK